MADNLPLQYQSAFGAGDDIVWTDASAAGHEFPNDGNVNIWVQNNNIADVELTVPSARDSNFGPYPAKTFQVLAGTTRCTPAWSPLRFSDPATGKLSFTIDIIANVKVAAVVRHTYYQDS